ncbi:hypothetical protein DIE19_28300 [Burkholderia sp. Bp9126]|nr:hypothetical protein DIE19_28300 [Burkholderia sp. Bp9126]
MDAGDGALARAGTTGLGNAWNLGMPVDAEMPKGKLRALGHGSIPFVIRSWRSAVYCAIVRHA